MFKFDFQILDYQVFMLTEFIGIFISGTWDACQQIQRFIFEASILIFKIGRNEILSKF